MQAYKKRRNNNASTDSMHVQEGGGVKGSPHWRSESTQQTPKLYTADIGGMTHIERTA